MHLLATLYHLIRERPWLAVAVGFRLLLSIVSSLGPPSDAVVQRFMSNRWALESVLEERFVSKQAYQWWRLALRIRAAAPVTRVPEELSYRLHP